MGFAHVKARLNRIIFSTQFLSMVHFKLTEVFLFPTDLRMSMYLTAHLKLKSIFIKGKCAVTPFFLQDNVRNSFLNSYDQISVGMGTNWFAPDTSFSKSNLQVQQITPHLE
jgi:hypothetical protein